MGATRLTAAIATAAVVILAGSAVALAAADPTPTPPPKIAVVARGDASNFADALAVGSVAGQLGAPVFTTPATSLASATADALASYNPELVIIVGGTAAITADVEAAIGKATGLPEDRVVRAAGKDRFETAAEIAAIFERLGIDAAFLPVGATATDSDLLDGLDSTAFQSAGDYLQPGDPIDASTLDGLSGRDLAAADLGLLHTYVDVVRDIGSTAVTVATLSATLDDPCGGGDTRHTYLVEATGVAFNTDTPEAFAQQGIAVDVSSLNPDEGFQGTSLAAFNDAGNFASRRNVTQLTPGAHTFNLVARNAGTSTIMMRATVMTAKYLGYSC